LQIGLSEVISIHDLDKAERKMSPSPRMWQRLAIFNAEVIAKKVTEKKHVTK